MATHRKTAVEDTYDERDDAAVIHVNDDGYVITLHGDADSDADADEGGRDADDGAIVDAEDADRGTYRITHDVNQLGSGISTRRSGCSDFDPNGFVMDSGSWSSRVASYKLPQHAF